MRCFPMTYSSATEANPAGVPSIVDLLVGGAANSAPTTAKRNAPSGPVVVRGRPAAPSIRLRASMARSDATATLRLKKDLLRIREAPRRACSPTMMSADSESGAAQSAATGNRR